MTLNVFSRLSSNHSLLSSDLISVACTFPFSTSLWLCGFNSRLLLLVFSYRVFVFFFFFSSVGLLPFYPVEVLVPTGAFESSCRKAPTKTVLCILPASSKPAPSFSSRSVLTSCFSRYFTVFHIVAVHLSPGDHCWNPGLYLLPAGEWAQVMETQTRDRKQGSLSHFSSQNWAWRLGT